MKLAKNQGLILLSLSLISVASFSYCLFLNHNSESVGAYDTSDLPTTINLNDSTSSQIRTYYSSLNSLSASERQGTNLLKNLKTILKNGQKYYSYDTDSAGLKLWKMYEITDRDWDKSPAGSDTYGEYDETTNTIYNYQYGNSKDNPKNNPYLHAFYVDRTVENQMRAWLYDGKVSHGNNGYWCIDREHLWQKSQGFEAEGEGGARGDPMHLVAGDSYVNSALHNDQFYGYVDFSQEYTVGDKWEYTTGNFLGYSSTMGDKKKSGIEKVFEPQDSDKGDIARALFYMMARYNYLSGSDSDGIDSNNPNLEITQDSQTKAAYTSSTSETGKIGVLTDLLAWHHADPVDEYEIHRNNLLFNNYTNNRNPFIDFPEWVDYIWGTARYEGRKFKGYSSTPTGYAKPGTDIINGYNEAEVVNVTGVSLNKDQTTIIKGESEHLFATVTPDNATNPDVVWTSSDSTIASVNNSGIITAHEYGVVTITVTTEDGSFTDTCEVTVAPNSISAKAIKTYYVGDAISKDDIVVTTDDHIEVEDFTFLNNNYQFKYEDANSGGALTNKTFANSISYHGKTCSLTVQVQRKAYKKSGTFTDTLDKEYTGVPGNTYASWSNKKGPTSDMIYAGNNSGGYSSIQLRGYVGEDVSHAGIVTTYSSTFVSSVEVTWNSNTAEGRILNVYGKNTPYTSPDDLYDENLSGDLLGTIVYGSSTSLAIDGDYDYVGVCVPATIFGAVYLTDITFNYGVEQFAKNIANFVMYEDTNGQCTSKTPLAISYYDELDTSGKEEFMTSDDYVISKGRERFIAWLNNQGKSVDDDYSIVGSNSYINSEEINDSKLMLSIVIIASISALSLAICLVIKKRKYHR